jgi:CRP/FNR family transcriptional regulator, cyclic AMP receptor protein
MKQLFDTNVFLSENGEGRKLGDYRRNVKIFSQGDPGDAVFYIHAGKVKLSIVSEQGKEAVIAILGGAEFFGEGCLAGQARRIATATAVSKCVIMRLEKTTMVRALKDEPSFSGLFLSYLLSRNVRLEGDLVDQLLNSSERRLARVLLQLANADKEKSEHRIAKISQETLAAIVGTTRPRVNFFMNKFRKLGLIEYNSGSTVVHSSLRDIVLPDLRLDDARRPCLPIQR